jgi:hypothetical protein
MMGFNDVDNDWERFCAWILCLGGQDLFTLLQWRGESASGPHHQQIPPWMSSPADTRLRHWPPRPTRQRLMKSSESGTAQYHWTRFLLAGNLEEVCDDLLSADLL